MITVDELMTRELYTLQQTDSVYHARELMTHKKIRHILVVDDNNMFIGLLTQRDVLSATVSIFADIDDAERNELEQSIPIKEVMTTDIVVAEEGTDLREIAMHLLEAKHGCLPIVTGGVLKGIVTEADFVKLALSMMDRMSELEKASARTLN